VSGVLISFGHCANEQTSLDSPISSSKPKFSLWRQTVCSPPESTMCVCVCVCEREREREREREKELWVNFSPSHLCCRCGIETFLLHLWKKREWRGEPGEGVRLYSECGKAICAPLKLSILWSLDTWTNQSWGVLKITKKKSPPIFY